MAKSEWELRSAIFSIFSTDWQDRGQALEDMTAKTQDIYYSLSELGIANLPSGYQGNEAKRDEDVRAMIEEWIPLIEYDIDTREVSFNPTSLDALKSADPDIKSKMQRTLARTIKEIQVRAGAIKEKKEQTFKEKLDDALAKAFGYRDKRSVPSKSTEAGKLYHSTLDHFLAISNNPKNRNLDVEELIRGDKEANRLSAQEQYDVFKQEEADQEQAKIAEDAAKEDEALAKERIAAARSAGINVINDAPGNMHRILTELGVFTGEQAFDQSLSAKVNIQRLTSKQRAALDRVAADASRIAGPIKNSSQALLAIHDALSGSLDMRSDTVEYELLSPAMKAYFQNIPTITGKDRWVFRPKNQKAQIEAEYRNLATKRAFNTVSTDAGDTFTIGTFTDADSTRMAAIAVQLGFGTFTDEQAAEGFVPTTAEELFGKGWDKRPGLDPEWNQMQLDEHNEKRRQEYIEGKRRQQQKIRLAKIEDRPTLVRPPGGYVPGQMYSFPGSEDIILPPDPETGEARYASGRPGYFGIPVTDFTKRDPFKRPASEEEAAVSYEVVPTRGETQSMIDRRIPSALTQFQKQAGESSPLGTAEAQRIQSALPNLRREYDKRVQEIAQQTGSSFDPRGVYDKRFIPTIGAMGEPGTTGYREQRPAYDTFQDFLKKRRKTGQFQAPQQAAAASGTSSAIPFGRSLLRTRFG